MKHQFSVPFTIESSEETLTFEYMAGRHTFDSFVSHLRDQRHQQRQTKASPTKAGFKHEAQKILCFTCVSFAIVLLFAVIDFAG
jgi:hypothetical protein